MNLNEHQNYIVVLLNIHVPFLKAIFELAHTHRNFGDAFANIGAREPQFKASEAFTKFGEAHRQIDRHAITLLRTVKPVRRK